MKMTKYEYEPVAEFWQKMRNIAADLQKSVGNNLARWQVADNACQGVKAVTSAVTYLSNAKVLADGIVEASEAGYRLNEEYAEQLAEAAADIEL